MIRLFIETEKLTINQQITISDADFNYLVNVMRLKVDEQFLVFNGIDGEFLAQISQISKKKCQIILIKKTKDQPKPNKISLAFAPIKNARQDFVAQKSCELGVYNLYPLLMQHSIVDKINYKKFNANLKEACEQCNRLDIPKLFELQKLTQFCQNLTNKILILADESGGGKKVSQILPKLTIKPDQEIIIFIGPEGGFSKQEFAMFETLPNLIKISLGKTILRADTAAISALTLINEFTTQDPPGK